MQATSPRRALAVCVVGTGAEWKPRAEKTAGAKVPYEKTKLSWTAQCPLERRGLGRLCQWCARHSGVHDTPVAGGGERAADVSEAWTSSDLWEVPGGADASGVLGQLRLFILMRFTNAVSARPVAHGRNHSPP